MSTSVLAPQAAEVLSDSAVRADIHGRIDRLMAALPKAEETTAEQRRGIIARYSSVLEPNFIYWMTAALMSIKAEQARPIILENLHEEIGDAHPVMLRNFAIAAKAFPTSEDSLAVTAEMNAVRRFLGKFSGVPTLLAMAFFEGFIQQFMSYLASLAIAQGSTDLEYTDVHGVCDVAHTEGLFQALNIEREINPMPADGDMFEGVHLLEMMITKVVHG